MPLRHLSAIHQNNLGHCESIDALTYTGHFCELTNNWIQRDSRVNQAWAISSIVAATTVAAVASIAAAVVIAVIAKQTQVGWKA